MTLKHYMVTIVAGSMAAGPASATMILNGSFEDNKAGGTIYNMTNDVFNATVDDATAWGGGMEIDLMTFGGGFGLDPVDGDWHLGLHARDDGDVDAFSFHLSGSIVGGTSYDLSFFAAANTSFDSLNDPLEIGVSSSADSFGTLVYTSDPLSFDSWSEHVTSFVAPVGGDFLTVRITGLDTWAHIDAFVLTPVPAPGALATLGLFGLFGSRGRRSA